MVSSLLKRRTLLKRLGAAVVVTALIRHQTGELRAQDLALPADGKGNALPGLKRLLNEAEKKGKGTVRLPAGRFLIAPDSQGAAITLPANVRLEGAGVDKTTLVVADGASGNVINAPYGNVQVADLTVDGNASNRARGVKGLGANIRLQSDDCLLERVRILNSAGYGIAVGQRHYARNIVIRDVEIVNSGSDGIDIKNKINQTANILVERVTVRGFGGIADEFSRSQFAEGGAHAHKAGVDLRGANCEVRGLTIIGVRNTCVGLRFRPGDTTTRHGDGAHRGIAQGVVVSGAQGAKAGTGIQVSSNGVTLQDIHVDGMRLGVDLSASDLEIRNGRISRSAETPLRAKAKSGEQAGTLRCQGVTFADVDRLEIQGAQAASFDQCIFSNCTRGFRTALQANPRIVLKNCTFDESCKS